MRRNGVESFPDSAENGPFFKLMDPFRYTNLNNTHVSHIETKTHSFVLRIWFEQTSLSDNQGEWRGHVTDVTSHERRYFRTAEELIAFLSDRMKSSRTHQEDAGAADAVAAWTSTGTVDVDATTT